MGFAQLSMLFNNVTYYYVTGQKESWLHILSIYDYYLHMNSKFRFLGRGPGKRRTTSLETCECNLRPTGLFISRQTTVTNKKVRKRSLADWQRKLWCLGHYRECPIIMYIIITKYIKKILLNKNNYRRKCVQHID